MSPTHPRSSSLPIVRMGLIALLGFALDQLSKAYVLHVLDLASVKSIQVWPPYLNFLMAWNKGVNFGLFSTFDFRWILVAFSVAVSVGVVLWVRDKQGWIAPLAAGALVGGALGNAVDRVVYGAVVDFINMGCCGVNNPYAFNIADVLVILGAVLLVIGQESKAPAPGAGKTVA